MSDDHGHGSAPDPQDPPTEPPPTEPFASPSGPYAPPPATPATPADRWAPPTPGAGPAPHGDQAAPWEQAPAYGQPPVYGQAPAYGQVPTYGQVPNQVAPYYGAPGPFARAHGRATAALVLGIIGTVCGVLCFCTYGVALIGSLGSPFAIWLGLTARREIDAAPGTFSNRGVAVAGFITGIVGTVLLVVDLVIIVLALTVALDY